MRSHVLKDDGDFNVCMISDLHYYKKWSDVGDDAVSHTRDTQIVKTTLICLIEL